LKREKREREEDDVLQPPIKKKERENQMERKN